MSQRACLLGACAMLLLSRPLPAPCPDHRIVVVVVVVVVMVRQHAVCGQS